MSTLMAVHMLTFLLIQTFILIQVHFLTCTFTHTDSYSQSHSCSYSHTCEAWMAQTIARRKIHLLHTMLLRCSSQQVTFYVFLQSSVYFLRGPGKVNEPELEMDDDFTCTNGFGHQTALASLRFQNQRVDGLHLSD